MINSPRASRECDFFDSVKVKGGEGKTTVGGATRFWKRCTRRQVSEPGLWKIRKGQPKTRTAIHE
jgi:hypothetical protein